MAATKKAAKTTKSTALAKAKPTGTALANIDAELETQAGDLAKMLGSSSSQRITVEPTGDFMLGDQNLGNEIDVIVVDWRSRNNFYINPYDAKNPSPPDCYAIGMIIDEMAPESDSPEPQNDACATCPMNAWGSARTGAGKACQNRRHIAVLLVDPENPDAHNAPDAPIYLMDISPANLKYFDGAVKQAARVIGHPIKAQFHLTGKNAGTYATIAWQDPIPNPDYAQHAVRRSEVVDMLERHPDYAAYEAKQKAAPARRSPPQARRAAGAKR